jgi:hypothetical protein
MKHPRAGGVERTVYEVGNIIIQIRSAELIVGFLRYIFKFYKTLKYENFNLFFRKFLKIIF